ncbi:MAG: DUF2490 domain-containing protein [Algoriphagus sp.]|nr:DUF2490 domain-containing protein [Algoriphagus sp.]
MKVVGFLILLNLFLPLVAEAQREVTQQESLWWGYFFTAPLNENWYNVTEVQERHFVSPVSQNQFLIRTRFHRHIGEKWDGSFGIVLFLHNRPGKDDQEDFTQPEIRPHAEVEYKTVVGKMGFEHRFRSEVRFFKELNDSKTDLGEAFELTSFRFRYRIQFSVLLKKLDENRSLKLKFGDELMVMAGGKLGPLVFDQNRIYADLSLDLNPNLALELGYVNWFQSNQSGGYLERHIIRTTLRHQ